jgi:uncharacterized protein YjbI with pentapeptide repeats
VLHDLDDSLAHQQRGIVSSKMADSQQLALIRQGAATWNQWREANRLPIPDLNEAYLTRANLIGADLSEANLARAEFNRADLSGANLILARLANARLGRADLSLAKLDGTTCGSNDLSETKGLTPVST